MKRISSVFFLLFMNPQLGQAYFHNIQRERHPTEWREISDKIPADFLSKENIFCRVVLPPLNVEIKAANFALHGLKSDSRYFHSGNLVGRLAMSGLVSVMCDHPGHGLSGGAREVIRVREVSHLWARLIHYFSENFSKDFGNEVSHRPLPYLIMGHSMGANLAAAYLQDLSQKKYSLMTPQLEKPLAFVQLSPAIGQDGIKGALDTVSGRLPHFLTAPGGWLASKLNLNLPIFPWPFSHKSEANIALIKDPSTVRRGIGFLPWKLIYATSGRHTLNPITAIELARSSRRFTQDTSWTHGIPILIAISKEDEWVGPNAAQRFQESLGPNNCRLILIGDGVKHDTLSAPEPVIDKILDYVKAVL